MKKWICCILVLALSLSGKSSIAASVASNDKVILDQHAIKMPLNRILLIRRNNEFCAIKFIRYWKTYSWKTNKGDRRFAEYIGYYWDNDKLDIKQYVLKYPKLIGIGRLSFAFDDNMFIECNKSKLLSSGNGWVYFSPPDQPFGDYGIEFGPTIWNSIDEVNISDEHIKWFRYDETRCEKEYSIDELWTRGE